MSMILRKSEPSQFALGRSDIRALETRIVFDAALAETLTDATSDTLSPEVDTFDMDISTVIQHLAASPAITSHDRSSIAFFDSNVDDIATLLKGLDANVEVVLLEGTRDGLTQIADILSIRTGIDEIHIFSHGAEGVLQLGTGSITSDTMQSEYLDELATIKAALSDSADILIYGCDFGAGETGQWTVDLLAELTGADVAASSDTTGHNTFGGDWDLELTSGILESAVAISMASQESWHSSLATIAVDTTADNLDSGITAGNGSHTITWLNTNKGTDGKISLREAIIAANNTAGADTITLAAGTYTLTLTGASEDNSATGDLDIRSDITITGAGAANTIINGNQIDRVFHVDAAGGGLTMSGVAVTGGKFAGGGGGIYVWNGALNLSDSTIYGNDATGSVGGGIWLDDYSSGSITRTSIYGNSATHGGGVTIATVNNYTISNSTISTNTIGSGVGGNVYAYYSPNLTLSYNTIVNSTGAAWGGGIYVNAGTVNMLGNIVSDNTQQNGDEVFGTITSQGYNIVENDKSAAAGFTATGDKLNTDPGLQAITNISGQYIHTITTSSAAYNAGGGAAPSVDQRNATRVGTADIGAYEVTNSTPSDTSATSTTNGGLDINTSGNNAYLIADDGSALLGGRTQITLEARFSISNPAASENVLFSYAVDGATDNEVFLRILPSGRISFTINGSNVQTSATYSQLLDGSTNTVSVSWNSTGGTVDFYVNGAPVQTSTGIKSGHTINAGGTLVLARDQDSELGGFEQNQLLSGVIYDARIFSTVLSAGTISANHASDVPYNTTSLAANWQFNSLSTSNVIIDTVSGNNLSVGRATGTGFTTGTVALNLSVSEDATNGTAVGTVMGTDAERTAKINALLAADSTLRYSAETNQFYRFVNSSLTWTAAEAAARSGSGTSLLNGITGQLVTIRSAAENEVIWNLANAYSRDIWISASDASIEGAWRWLESGVASDQFWSGDELGSNVGGNYENWRAGQPNAATAAGDFARMDFGTGEWTDEDTSANGRYIIEWNADDVLDATNALTYLITSQTTSGAFTINTDTGVITVADGTKLDYEGATTHTITVLVTDSEGLTYEKIFTISLSNVYEAPSITSNGAGASSSVNAAENQTAVTTVTSFVDSSKTITYSISGGADQNLFQIDAATGVLSFKSAPDFETKADSGNNGIYDVTVQISDGTSTDTQAIAVTVTNVNEAPTITSNGGGDTASINVAENQTAVTTVTSTDVDAGATKTFSITGGADQNLFQIDANTGVITFKSAPNYQNKADSGNDGVYDVIVQVTDGSLTDTQTLAITVTDVNEAPTITSNGGGDTASINVAENQTAVTTVTSTDVDAGATKTFSITGGNDQNLFQIDANTGVLTFKSAPNYESTADSGNDGVYDVIVQVSDGMLTDTQTLSITVTDVNEAPTITSNGGGDTASINVAENQTAVTTVTSTDVDAGATKTFSITGGNDQNLFQIDANTGVLTFKSAPNYESKADSGNDGVYDVIVQVTDGSLTDTQTLSITVTDVNEAPVITSNGGGPTAAINVAENQTAVNHRHLDRRGCRRHQDLLHQWWRRCCAVRY